MNLKIPLAVLLLFFLAFLAGALTVLSWGPSVAMALSLRPMFSMKGFVSLSVVTGLGGLIGTGFLHRWGLKQHRQWALLPWSWVALNMVTGLHLYLSIPNASVFLGWPVMVAVPLFMGGGAVLGFFTGTLQYFVMRHL